MCIRDRLDSFALEGSERDALQRLRVARQLKSYACTTLMGSGEYNLNQLESPPVPAEERREALRWALKEMVSYPLDGACIDVLDIPILGMPPGRSAGVLVVSAAEQAVRSRVGPFEEARIILDAVDIPELAQRNVAALLEDENRGLVFLRIDETGMMLTLSFHGELIAVRSGEINTLQLNGGDADQLSLIHIWSAATLEIPAPAAISGDSFQTTLWLSRRPLPRLAAVAALATWTSR